MFSLEISKALMNFKPTETWKYLKWLTIVYLKKLILYLKVLNKQKLVSKQCKTEYFVMYCKTTNYNSLSS